MMPSKTSVEVKDRWKKANYKPYQISLRIEDDKDLIEYIEAYKARHEGKGVSDMFRAGVELFMKEGRQ